MLFAALVYSESSFQRNKRHALPYVKGLCGVNEKAHPEYKNIADDWRMNLLCGANELRNHLLRADSNLVALAYYKGFSALGIKQARHVIDIYRGLK